MRLSCLLGEDPFVCAWPTLPVATIHSWHCVPVHGSPHLDTWLHVKPTLHAEAGCSTCCHRCIHRRQRKSPGGELASPSVTPSKSKRINTCSSESYYLARGVDQSSFRGRFRWEANLWAPHGGAGRDLCAKVEKRAGFMKWSNMAPAVTETLF